MIQEVVENAGLEAFAEIGLVLFVAAFVLVLVRVWLMDVDEAQQRATMPLDDDRDG